MIIDTEDVDAKSPTGPGAPRPAQPGPSILTSGPTSPVAGSSSRSAVYGQQSGYGSTSGHGGYTIGGEDEPTSPISSPRSAASQTQPLLSTIDIPPPPNYQAALSSPVVSLPAHHRSLYRYDPLSGEVWEDIRVKRAVERRFFRAFAVAIIVWVLFVLLGKILADVTVVSGFLLGRRSGREADDAVRLTGDCQRHAIQGEHAVGSMFIGVMLRRSPTNELPRVGSQQRRVSPSASWTCSGAG